MSDTPLTDTSTLKPGDVVQIAVKLKDKITGDDYWWRRFAVVTSVSALRRFSAAPNGPKGTIFEALTLKMHPVVDRNADRSDHRLIDLTEANQVVTFLPPERHPQGVAAMRLKALTMGWVKLGEGT